MKFRNRSSSHTVQNLLHKLEELGFTTNTIFLSNVNQRNSSFNVRYLINEEETNEKDNSVILAKVFTKETLQEDAPLQNITMRSFTMFESQQNKQLETAFANEKQLIESIVETKITPIQHGRCLFGGAYTGLLSHNSWADQTNNAADRDSFYFKARQELFQGLISTTGDPIVTTKALVAGMSPDILEEMFQMNASEFYILDLAVKAFKPRELLGDKTSIFSNLIYGKGFLTA